MMGKSQAQKSQASETRVGEALAGEVQSHGPQPNGPALADGSPPSDSSHSSAASESRSGDPLLGALATDSPRTSRQRRTERVGVGIVVAAAVFLVAIESRAIFLGVGEFPSQISSQQETATADIAKAEMAEPRLPLSSVPVVSLSRVDLNQATSDQLQIAPMIGPRLATRIVEYRQQYGPFRSIDQLGQVPGIGPSRVRQLQPFLVISGVDQPRDREDIQANDWAISNSGTLSASGRSTQSH